MAEDAEVQKKIRKAVKILLLQRHSSPGVKGWELKKSLGKDYMKIVDLVREELSRLDLEVKIVGEEGDSAEDYDRARFLIVMKHPPSAAELVGGGWRIDDMAILAATLAYAFSRHGKTPRKDVEDLLKDKFPRWKIDLNLDRYVRLGYLVQGEDDVLSVGWRTRAEVDQKTLLNLLLSTPSRQESQAK